MMSPGGPERDRRVNLIQFDSIQSIRLSQRHSQRLPQRDHWRKDPLRNSTRSRKRCAPHRALRIMPLEDYERYDECHDETS